jgi:hypothetical protein
VKEEPPPGAMPLDEALGWLVDHGFLTVTTFDFCAPPAPPVPVRNYDPERIRALFADGVATSWGRLDHPLGGWVCLPDDARFWAMVEIESGNVLAVVRVSDMISVTIGDGGTRIGGGKTKAVVGRFYDVRVAIGPAPPGPPLARQRGQDDHHLLADMGGLVLEGMTPWAAAGQLAPKALGKGTVESKQKRLFDKYQKLSSAQN